MLQLQLSTQLSCSLITTNEYRCPHVIISCIVKPCHVGHMYWAHSMCIFQNLSCNIVSLLVYHLMSMSACAYLRNLSCPSIITTPRFHYNGSLQHGHFYHEVPVAPRLLGHLNTYQTLLKYILKFIICFVNTFMDTFLFFFCTITCLDMYILLFWQ